MIKSSEARELAEQSNQFIANQLRAIDQEITEAASLGKTSIGYVLKGHISLARRLADELVKFGYSASVRTEFGLITEQQIDISW